jgi:hypothetical protein
VPNVPPVPPVPAPGVAYTTLVIAPTFPYLSTAATPTL